MSDAAICRGTNRQNFGVKSQDGASPVVLNNNHNNKNGFCALPLAEPLAMHNGGSAAFLSVSKQHATENSDEGSDERHPGAGPARLECRSHRSPTWLLNRYTEG